MPAGICSTCRDARHQIRDGFRLLRTQLKFGYRVIGIATKEAPEQMVNPSLGNFWLGWGPEMAGGVNRYSSTYAGPCRQVLRIHAKDLLFYFCRCALVMPSPPASSISVVTEHAGATPRLVMSKTTFKVWLAAAHVTNDRVGDFISDARQDAQLPETITSAARLRSYLRTRHASPEALATVPAIWRRFQHWRDQRRCRNRKREDRETGKASGGRRDYSND
jgi:hypothetical protein